MVRGGQGGKLDECVAGSEPVQAFSNTIYTSHIFVSGQPRAKRSFHGMMNMSGDWTWRIHSPVNKVVSVWEFLEENNKSQKKEGVGMRKAGRR